MTHTNGDTSPRGVPRRDLALYERLISDGIAAADSRGGAVDHVTARRMAIWMLSRSQEPEFMRGLIRFTQDGAIAQGLKKRLRDVARTPGHPCQTQAARFLQYATARGTYLGPVGSDFAGLCDQIDQADTSLAALRERVREGHGSREPTREGPVGQQFIAIAHHDPASRTVSLILDDSTANVAIHAIAVNAADREAHMREVQQASQNLPETSYGWRNRQDIAARETRIAGRLRAVEHAYRTALDHGAAPTLSLTEITGSTDWTSDRELELE